MKFFQAVRLIHRAYKYKNRDDKGGIAYLLDSLQPGQTVFDIGAHKGGYLYFMRKRIGNTGKVFAFEPQLNLFAYLQRIKKLFNWHNVTIEQIALSDQKDHATLYIPSNKIRAGSSPGATLITHPERNDFIHTEEVETDTLDAYCQRHNLRPNLLKIDVEGNELKIFKGGVETLKKYKPKILVEIEARHIGKEGVLDTFMYLERLGYKGWFLLNTKRLPLSEFNFVEYQNVKDKPNYCNNFIFE